MLLCPAGVCRDVQRAGDRTRLQHLKGAHSAQMDTFGDGHSRSVENNRSLGVARAGSLLRDLRRKASPPMASSREPRRTLRCAANRDRQRHSSHQRWKVFPDDNIAGLTGYPKNPRRQMVRTLLVLAFHLLLFHRRRNAIVEEKISLTQLHLNRSSRADASRDLSAASKPGTHTA